MIMMLLRIYVGSSARIEHPFFMIFLLILGYLVYKMCQWFYHKLGITQQQCIWGVFIWFMCFIWSVILMDMKTTHTHKGAILIFTFISTFFGWVVPFFIFSFYNKAKRWFINT